MPINKKRQKLIDIFLAKNSQINLSAIRDEQGVMDKHIRDSLQLLDFFSFDPGSTIADVGTGGGFPLLPLAMSCPDCEFVGIDARKKKTIAVQDMADQLGLANVSVQRGRIEELKGKYDYVTARAVSHVEKLIPWVHNLIKPGGKLILYKQVSEEEREALFALEKKYQLWILREQPYQLFEGDIQRIIYILEKG